MRHLHLPLPGPMLCCLALLAALLAGCANPVLREAQQLSEEGRQEEALARLEAASKAQPQDKALKSAVAKQREQTLFQLLNLAEATRLAGQPEEFKQLLARAEAALPGHPRVMSMRRELERSERNTRLMDEARQAQKQQQWARAEAVLRGILAEDPGHTEARNMLNQIDEQRSAQTRKQSNLQLATSQKPVSLEFREAPLRTVFEALARAASVNFVFDKDVRGDAKVTLFLRKTTVEEAMRVILNTQQLGHKLLNDNTVLIYPNTSQKQRDLLDTVTRSFYLVNADPKQAQALIRTVAKTRDIFVDDRLNLIVVRDTPEVVRLIERLIAGIDLPDPEVMLELEVMEVSSKRINELGLNLVETATYGVPGSSGLITSSTTGLRWSVSNPLAVATLRGSKDTSNLLANPKIRARNREKAKISLGEKLPVFTTTTTTNTAVSNTVSITYVDVGLKLELEPQVQLNNEVIIKINLDVSNITNKVSGPEGSIAYQVGNRLATTTLRLKDGETQILAGLINDNDSRNYAGLPGIQDLPIINRLFGKNSDQFEKTEVVMLITPRIVRNLSQNALPVLPMASGTEAQPGAEAFFVEQGTVGSEGPPKGPLVPTARPARPGVPGAVQAVQPQATINGPEAVLPRASFQVTVRNGGGTPVETAVLYDLSMLSAAADEGQTGRVPLSLAPGATQSLTFTVKDGVNDTQTEMQLDNLDQVYKLSIGQSER